MIIESISVESFGKLNKLELTFNDSLNVIEGENESGKSTIASFIKYMLYGFTARNSESTLSDKKRYVSWHTSSAEGSMIVRTSSGERYKIMRKTTLTTSGERELYKESSSIIDMKTGVSVFPKQCAGEAILGVPAEIFENVAFVGQFSDSRTSPDTTEAIENLLFSGDERVNAQKAQDKLELARRALLHKNGKGGKIYELTTSLDELKSRFADTVEANREIFDCEELLAKTEAEIHANDTQSERLTACVEAYDKICTIREFDYLHAQERALASVKEQKSALLKENTYEGFLPDSDYITALAVARSKVADSRASYERTSDRVRTYRANSEPSCEHLAMRGKADAYGGVDAILQKARDYESVIQSSSKKARTLLCAGIPLCIILVGIFLVIASLSCRRRAKSAKTALSRLYADFGVTEVLSLSSLLETYMSEKRAYESAEALYRASSTELSEEEKSVSLARCELAALLSRWGIHDADNADIDEISEKVLAFQRSLSQLDSEIYRVAGACEEAREKLSGKDEEQIIDELKNLDPSVTEFIKANDINKIYEALSFCRSKGKALAEKERDIREKYLSLKAVTSSPSALQEKIYSTEQSLSALKKQHASYILALEAIEGAGERLRAQMSPRLSKYACDAISFITDGKYDELGVDSSLAMSCTYENELRSPDEFSAGTRMAIYLSLRMALIDMICDEKIPLCLDETLAYQDDTRAKKLISFLQRESKDKMQCFLFTCHTREASMLDTPDASVIRL